MKPQDWKPVAWWLNAKFGYLGSVPVIEKALQQGYEAGLSESGDRPKEQKLNMKITAQELIDELKKLPPGQELKFRFTKVRSWGSETHTADFDRIVFSQSPVVEFLSQ